MGDCDYKYANFANVRNELLNLFNTPSSHMWKYMKKINGKNTFKKKLGEFWRIWEKSGELRENRRIRENERIWRMLEKIPENCIQNSPWFTLKKSRQPLGQYLKN